MNREALIELRTKVEAGEVPVYAIMDLAMPIFAREVALMMGQAYGGSFEAAYALMKAVLPGFNWTLRETVDGWLAEVGKPDTFSEKSGQLSCGTTFTGVSFDNPGRAWLLALLAAIIAKEKGGE